MTFESKNFANFVEVVHNFGRSDVAKKMFIFNTCRLGLMPNLIKKSWTVSNLKSLGPKISVIIFLYFNLKLRTILLPYKRCIIKKRT